MMAGKALLFGDAGTAERIRRAPHPTRVTLPPAVIVAAQYP
jgi:hypothetical protein